MVISLKNLFRDLKEILKEKSLKEIFFGKKVSLSNINKRLLKNLKIKSYFKKLNGRKGNFKRYDFLHRGRGTAYLVKDPKNSKGSILLLAEDLKIQPGPDLYVYLSKDKKKNKGILDLGLLKGTKGGQSYSIKKSIVKLKDYKSVIIHCKKFDVYFSHATLSK